MTRIVLMGSGETAPAMVKTHRAVLAMSGPGDAVMLDTPYGFQVNADDLTSRTRRYFAESVGTDVQAASWRRRDLPARDAERALTLISGASWVFAGPGSPTYALDQWRDTPVVHALDDVLVRGGTVVLGSAAAVTAGRWALPVYEIYKVGVQPFWAPGLDLLGRLLDLPVAVVPHFDNNEGGTYDTRYCYLGHQRLRLLQDQLPHDAAVLGVDEHTAVLVDVPGGTVEVRGVGAMTVARPDSQQVVPAGSTVPIDELRAMVRGALDAARLVGQPPAESAGAPEVGEAEDGPGVPSLLDEVSALRDAFDDAVARRDVDDAVAAILAVDDAMVAWSADTLQSDALDRARRQLRAMVVRLGDVAREGVQDPSRHVAPLVEAILLARADAREARDFPTSDLLRDLLTTGGITVSDTPNGTGWSFDGGGQPTGDNERPDATTP